MKSFASLWRRSGRSFVLLLSLVPTPMLLFLSSASALYRLNQDVLQLDPVVLRPFLVLFTGAVATGALLAALARFRPVRVLLWGYYLVGVAFMLFSAARGQDGAVGLGFEIAVLAGTSVALERIADVGAVRLPVAAFGLALLVYEPAVFYADLRRPAPPPRPGDGKVDGTPRTSAKLPNIYHVLLDEFQTDFFDLARSPQEDGRFAGFVYYPRNLAVYHWTNMSLPSIFTGRKFRYDRRQDEYQHDAFDSQASFLFWLKRQGYGTWGFVPSGAFGVASIYAPTAGRRFGLFDRFVFHQDNARTELLAMNAETFWSLWTYSVVPRTLQALLRKIPGFVAPLDADDVKLLERNQFLPYSAPLVSVEGFERVILEEKLLPASGRYTFVHVVIPHEPHKLWADCSCERGRGKTGPLEQSRCALKLVSKYLDELKRLGRFDDSLILIHGDHGGNFEMKNGALTRSRARSLRTLLLVKPVGKTDRVGLEVSDDRTTLLDMGPLIFSRLGRRFVPQLENESLAAASTTLAERGFRLGGVFKTPSTRFPAGWVMSQTPQAYTEAASSTEVSLLVSGGPKAGAHVVPDFLGQQIDELYPDVVEWARAERTTFLLRFVEHVGVGRGIVIRQSPRIGTSLDRGRGIVLYLTRR